MGIGEKSTESVQQQPTDNGVVAAKLQNNLA